MMGLGGSHPEEVHSREWVTHGALGEPVSRARDRRTRQNEFGLAVELVAQGLVVKAKTVLKSEPGNQPLHMIGKLRQKRKAQFIKIV